ncbi:MAG: ABC-type metal ion transporter, periplasmic subunit [Acidimicrobiales bacterium]|nr:ABC-type metal ion transporter, periplasmic subunit [Acidimicrobiales bacterium]
MARTSSIVAAVALSLVAAGCSSGTSDSGASSGSKVAVVTTTTQLTDFARAVGGARVEVYGVLKPNIDPHDYEPSPADLNALAKADVIVKNGVGLEKWFDSTIKSAAPRGQIVDASTGITVRQGQGSEEKAGDPHVWHNPLNAAMMVTTIEKALEKADPADAATFRANLASYKDTLTKLDADIKSQVDTLTNKKLVTNHDAFGYYVDRYGLEFVGSIIPSFDTSAELSAKDTQDIVAKIRATGTKAVFSESSLPPKTAETIGAEAGVKVIAGENSLYGDTLGPPGSDGDTYVKMERHNTRVIVDNLR